MKELNSKLKISELSLHTLTNDEEMIPKAARHAQTTSRSNFFVIARRNDGYRFACSTT